MASHHYGGYSSMFGSSDPYESSLSRYPNPNPLASSAFEASKYSSSLLNLESSIYSNRSNVGGGIGYDGKLKRSAEALYNQNVPGSHNTIGQNDALLYSNSMFKHPRLESASNLPMYPQRPGEKDCSHYMLTRTCKFGEACKFDHPVWVPEGGVPDWKEVPLVHATESLPERPGEPDCPFYIKTQKCKFGFHCKFNHPKDILNQSTVGGDGVGAGFVDHSLLPERPSEPICVFYSKIGKCKFGVNCKFNHPKDIQIPSSGQSAVTADLAGGAEAKPFIPVTPAIFHNSKDLPIRPFETDCPFYLKTGSCKYGANCRYNHPERTPINPPLGANIGQTFMPAGASNLFPSMDPLLAQASMNTDGQSTLETTAAVRVKKGLGVSPAMHPQRPGQPECDFYMKTGRCNFGERCKYHHPVDRLAPKALMTQAQPSVKLTLAGLPRREGSGACAYYMKTGTCKYGVTCRFDHPPPGEAVAMATTALGGGGGGGGEVNAAVGGDGTAAFV